MTDITTPTRHALQLADAYANACFEQGLNQRTEDPAPENERKKLEANLARIDDYVTEINRLRNVIQSACIGGTDLMIERWKVLFPDEPVPSVKALQSHAARDVLAERQRQISVEGWTPEHDDEHKGGGMAFAAAAYAVHADAGPALTGTLWRWTGWALKWLKPKGRRSNLVRAGALILAEIERLDRASGIVAPPVCENCGESAPGCSGLFSDDGKACRFHGA